MNILAQSLPAYLAFGIRKLKLLVFIYLFFLPCMQMLAHMFCINICVRDGMGAVFKNLNSGICAEDIAKDGKRIRHVDVTNENKLCLICSRFPWNRIFIACEVLLPKSWQKREN